MERQREGVESARAEDLQAFDDLGLARAHLGRDHEHAPDRRREEHDDERDDEPLVQLGEGPGGAGRPGGRMLRRVCHAHHDDTGHVPVTDGSAGVARFRWIFRPGNQRPLRG
ncbi:hypothetical protein KFL01_11400 [Kocuria flava]|uniref:Uncharacterized protein n=1 Tax=Kocuria flava TaxID=446860 RepID=A0ABQ0X859_9MICC|nr:hypothetical protein KFL01_11400 [Kocuria flava]